MTKKLMVFAAALAVVTALVGAKVLIYPPVTVAATSEGLDINLLARNGHKDLPSFDAQYQRHLGVPDVLNTR